MKKNSLKSLLFELEREELIEIIFEMVKINPKNKQYLDVMLKHPEEINYKKIISDAKYKISKYIFGRGELAGKSSLKLRDAKRLISETAKLLGAYPLHIADLKLYYVETCNDFTRMYGDINEAFYDSVTIAFMDFKNFIIKNPEIYDIFKERLDKLLKNSRHIGYGYSDNIEDIHSELVNEFS